MNKKSLFLIILLSIICCIGFGGWSYFMSGSSSFALRSYISITDEAVVDSLLEENAFWLFHDPNYQEGKKKAICEIASGVHHHYDTNEIDGIDSAYKTIVAYNKKDGKIIGFINYYIFEMVNPNANGILKIGRVHFLCVDKMSRRLGVGEQLLKAVLEEMKKEKVMRAFLITRPENMRAKKLYYKFLFTEAPQELNDIYEKNGYDLLIKDF